MKPNTQMGWKVLFIVFHVQDVFILRPHEFGMMSFRRSIWSFLLLETFRIYKQSTYVHLLV